MTYPDLADYKAWAGITETGDDATLTRLIAAATAMIEGPQPLGTGRTFYAATDTTRQVDWPDDGGRVLPLWDVGELASITTVTNGDGDSTVIPATEYVTHPRRGGPFYALELKVGSSYAWEYTDSPEGAIHITGRWAYSADVPADIYQAHLRLVDFMYRSRGGSGDQAVRTEAGIILPSRLPKDIDDILAGYRDILGGAG
jgi:uncharacterized phiE125 gp8 family phage protein